MKIPMGKPILKIFIIYSHIAIQSEAKAQPPILIPTQGGGAHGGEVGERGSFHNPTEG